MNIVFNQVMPTPLASINHSAESIWGNKIELKSGERILLNASSGKGKSTFTFTSIGLRKDYSGEITYDGVDIKTFSPNDWTPICQGKMSVIFQDLQLFPNLSVEDNLILKNMLQENVTVETLKKQLEFLGIGDKWKQDCGLLSMGQQQRVAIVRALSQPFEWLIMDEPFSHLDKENAQKCMKLIHERCEELGAGFVLTSLGDTYDYNYTRELKL
jgi:ABC-type lipoprotein export system ATPase subunit